MLIRDGFPGQRLRVLAKPVLTDALVEPITHSVLVTDVGYFPYAVAHGRNRPVGTSSAIIILCVAGRGHLRLDRRQWNIEAGQAAVVAQRRPHMYWADLQDPWTIWWMHIDGQAVPELVETIQGAADEPVFAVEDLMTATSLIEAALAAYEAEETIASRTAASGVAWNLLTQLAAQRLRGHPDVVDRIDLLRNHIRENYTHSIALHELAELVNLSPSYTAALFKSAVGMSVTEYVKRLRSAKARELLITTNDSISQVGRAVGYEDALYFSRQFRAINGVSPREFRTSR